MEPYEQRTLLTQAREWFSEAAHVAHYKQEAVAGPTAAEVRLLHALPTSGRIVDLGCGAGRIAFHLADKGYDVTGVEVSQPLVATARALAEEHGSTAKFQHVQPMSLPFEDAVFDAAIAIKVHCYIPSRAGRLRYLTEAGRVMRPGAPLLLTSYVAPTEQEAIDALAGDKDHLRAAAQFSNLEPLDTFSEGRGYVHWFTPETLRAELASSPAFDTESLTDDSPGGLLRLAVLRRTDRVIAA